ncbi:hypothetical protein [Gottfriedia solisilvae]|uniref:hypothetical protein n=1 Tax=Gottfriedia solisilvae TaxID=1516104 RepID=UPI003D2F44FC
MAFNKNKKIVTTALTAAMVASAVAPVAAAKLTPAQDATKAVDGYYKLSVKTKADVSNSAKVKKAALAKVAKLTSKKDAKLKASLTAKVAKKSAAINKYYQTVIVAAENEAKAIAAVDAFLKAAAQVPVTAETTKEQVEKAYADVLALIAKVKTEAKKTEFKAAADKMKADALAKIEELASPKVASVTAINASQIQVTFNKQVLESDLIDGAGALKNVTVTPQTVDGVLASTPGTLKPVLSEDGKTLTLTTATGAKFNGTYSVVVAKNTVKIVKDGSYVGAFEGTVAVSDSVRPTLTGVTYNAAGTVAYLAFSESVTTLDADFSLTSVSRTDGAALDATTVAGFTKADFTLSATKRNVIEVSLTDIAAADANKELNVNLVGVKDEAGNLISPNPVSVKLTKDTTVKAQANIVSVKRASATTVEVAFDKELQTAPTVAINGGAGVLASATGDSKVYEVTLTAPQQALTGIKDVAVSAWNAYNTAGAAGSVTKIVDFTVEKTAPVIESTQLTKIGNVNYLVVNFNEEVTLADLAAGTLTGTVSKPNGDLVAIPTVNFSAATFHNQPLTATKSKTVKINLDTLTTGVAPAVAYTLVPGTFNVKISSGIAKDAFGNASAEKATSFTVSTSTAKLAAPTSFVSKATNPSVAVVTFADKVDVASAETVANYSIEGATITAAKVITNSAAGATVELTLASGSVNHEGVRLVSVKNVKGYADSFAAMNDYSAIKSFTENVAPKLAGATAVKLTSTSTIVVDFDENLVDASAGTDFDVYQNGAKIGSASALDGSDASKVIITLTAPVSSTAGLVVKAASTIDLTDSKLNSVVFTDTAVSN